VIKPSKTSKPLMAMRTIAQDTSAKRAFYIKTIVAMATL